jgi:hypothetical protein
MPLYKIGICELTWFLVPLQCKYPSWTEWRDFDLKRMLDNVGLPDKLDIWPPADTNSDPWHSTQPQGSRCLCHTKSQHLNAIVSAVVLAHFESF